MSLVEVKVPDIGDFKDVDVIEVNIKPGDVIEVEQALMTLESDKASIEVPSDTAGTVKEVRVKTGDKVSEGTVIAIVESAGAGSAKAASVEAAKEPEKAPAQAAAQPAAQKQATAAPQAGSFSGSADIECDIVVLGSGPGGYSAAFRSADLGMKTVLVERYATLGGVCLNVGCIPSKALLHVAAVVDEAKHLAAHGVAFGEPAYDLAKLRGWKNRVVSKLTSGLAGMAKLRKVTVLQGVGTFVGPNHLAVDAGGTRKVVQFRNAIIAAGSQSASLPFLPKDPRIVDSTGALELPQQAKRMLVIGGGIIGLEMGTVYSTLGARLDVVEVLDGLMLGADRDLVNVWQKFNAARFDKLMLKTKATQVEATPGGLVVTFEGPNAPAEPQRYDMILVSVGRSPNGKRIDAARAGVAVTDRGFINVDRQMRTNVA